MQQPPKFMPDKELSKVGGSLWLYIIMQLTLSFLFSFVAMPLIMYSLYYDYSAINACIEMLISFISGIILLWFMSSSFKQNIKDLKDTDLRKLFHGRTQRDNRYCFNDVFFKLCDWYYWSFIIKIWITRYKSRFFVKR